MDDRSNAAELLALRARVINMEEALKNVLLLAARLERKIERDADLDEALFFIQDVPGHLIRFCAEAGVKASPLRSEHAEERND